MDKKIIIDTNRLHSLVEAVDKMLLEAGDVYTTSIDPEEVVIELSKPLGVFVTVAQEAELLKKELQELILRIPAKAQVEKAIEKSKSMGLSPLPTDKSTKKVVN